MAPSQEEIRNLPEGMQAQFHSWPEAIQNLVAIEDHDGSHRFSFKEKSLSGMSLMGINLQGVNLQGAHLCYAQLQGAKLSGADMSGAHAHGANLEDADVTGAKLDKINLAWAILTGVKGLCSGWKDSQGNQQPNTITICKDTVLPVKMLTDFPQTETEFFQRVETLKPSNNNKHPQYQVSDYLNIQVKKENIPEWGNVVWSQIQNNFWNTLNEGSILQAFTAWKTRVNLFGG
jgi:hypothetical protein